MLSPAHVVAGRCVALPSSSRDEKRGRLPAASLSGPKELDSK